MHLNLSKSAVYTSVTKFSKRNWGPLSPLEADRVRDWQGLVGSRLIDVVRQAECQCYTLTYLTTITINHRGYYPALILQYHKIVISPHITILHQPAPGLGQQFQYEVCEVSQVSGRERSVCKWCREKHMSGVILHKYLGYCWSRLPSPREKSPDQHFNW